MVTAIFFINSSYIFTLKKEITLCSWNLKDFGKTASAEKIAFIANVVKEYDIVALQEIVAIDPGGAQAVAKLAAALNITGSKWDYSISNPTFSSSYKTERYAFLWKTASVQKKGMSWLEEKYKLEIDREPFYQDFVFAGKEFTIVNFHAITKTKQPETEIKYFKFLPEQYAGKTLIFAGDFNVPETDTVFNPLKKMGWLPALHNQKTTLKKECIADDCLASVFDNIFYPSGFVTMSESGIIPFYLSLPDLTEANIISDHLPIYMRFSLIK